MELIKKLGRVLLLFIWYLTVIIVILAFLLWPIAIWIYTEDIFIIILAYVLELLFIFCVDQVFSSKS